MKLWSVFKRAVILCLSLAMFTPFLAVSTAHAKSDRIYTSWRDNLAIEGYDPVTFFTGTPQKGQSTYEASYKGALWRFTSRANMDLFKTNPSAFAPQYGGYCAWAVAKGKLAKGSPEYWHVEDGQLFLNFNARLKKKWDKNKQALIIEANEKWPEILND